MDLTESPPARGAGLPRVLPVAAGVGALGALAGVWLLTGPGLLLLAACVVSGYGLTHLSALPFTVEERAVMEVALDRAAEAIDTALREGLPVAMNRFNVNVAVPSRL